MRYILPFVGRSSGPSVYATWNPADKANNLTLSGGNLVSTVGGLGCARSTISKASGKWYFEVTNTSASGNYAVIGACDGTTSLATFAGFPPEALGYYFNTGVTFHNNIESPYDSAGASVGQTVGCYFDVGAGSVGFITPRGDKGIAITGLTGPLFAIIGTGSGATDGSKTANFGATAFVYTPPTGYNAGLYN